MPPASGWHRLPDPSPPEPRRASGIELGETAHRPGRTTPAAPLTTVSRLAGHKMRRLGHVSVPHAGCRRRRRSTRRIRPSEASDPDVTAAACTSRRPRPRSADQPDRSTVGTIRLATFTVTAVVILAIVIGGTLSIGALVDTLWLRSLPYHGAERVVTLCQRHASGERGGVTPGNFLAWRSSPSC